MEVRIGEDRLPRDLVERDVLRRQIRCGGDHERVADPVRIADRPRQRLHAAEASAHHGGPAVDTQAIGETRLRVDPVLDGDDREVGTPRLAGGGIVRRGPARAEAAAEVVHADDEEAVGIERLARTHHVVPPADVVLVTLVVAGDVMRRVQRMADQHGVAAVGIERAVGLVGELERIERASAGERQRLLESCACSARTAPTERRCRARAWTPPVVAENDGIEYGNKKPDQRSLIGWVASRTA